MNRDFDEEQTSKRKNTNLSYGMDSPEDFRNQSIEQQEEASEQEATYCRWLDDYGWI